MSLRETNNSFSHMFQDALDSGDKNRMSEVINLANNYNFSQNPAWTTSVQQKYDAVAQALNGGASPASSTGPGYSFSSPEQAQAAVNARMAELQGQVDAQQQAYIKQYNDRANQINAQLASMGSSERIELLGEDGNPVSEKTASATPKSSNAQTLTEAANSKSTNTKSTESSKTNTPDTKKTTTDTKKTTPDTKKTTSDTKKTTADTKKTKETVTTGVTGAVGGSVGLMQLNNETITGIVSRINECVEAIENEWKSILNNEISKINNSWAAAEAKTYVDKVMNAGNKIKNVESGIKLLGQTYQKVNITSGETSQGVNKAVSQI